MSFLKPTLLSVFTLLIGLPIGSGILGCFIAAIYWYLGRDVSEIPSIIIAIFNVARSNNTGFVLALMAIFLYIVSLFGLFNLLLFWILHHLSTVGQWLLIGVISGSGVAYAITGP